ncbi:MAG: hypothetical protein ABF932_04675 [Gluconobacter potus]|uniref:Uncharacterized protein n=1 Tax=Gluconobacter potus TaxID=2724927 RepID=A0ABR9YIE8_9PROT|nr:MULTISPECIES: hypothetical protein [Gluconobacter]MBF0863469.1 hypothetical protein [Gluconobacter sp. R71656]MBF0866276.1 hypothetical protein [Gluconobacter sp. R75628]MBF0872596.1 hypothetical protein [Gluconobacter sp. R75629]MBF0881562.1 hypothetical protein [Gluconobacter potus]
MKTRKYVRPTTATWDEAAELYSRGLTQDDIAERLNVSVRSVANNLHDALDRRRAALAASVTGTAATSPVPSIATASVPNVTEREEATKHWRATAWADSQAIQARLREEMSKPAPDARAIRAFTAGADALRNLIKIGADILEVDKHAADEIIPELVVREITPEEVAAIRAKQRLENGDLDPAELAALKEEASNDESDEEKLVITEE